MCVNCKTRTVLAQSQSLVTTLVNDLALLNIDQAYCHIFFIFAKHIAFTIFTQVSNMGFLKVLIDQ